MYNKNRIIEFFNIINEWNERGIERELVLSNLNEKAISIIGPRRSGKSFYLLKYVKKGKKNIMYMDFDHISFRNITAEDVYELVKFYESFYNIKVKSVILDEIQNVNGWESLVKSLLLEKYRIYLSGSSSKLLSKEIATQLRGRTIIHHLYPFSFREFLSFKDINLNKQQILSLSEKERILTLLSDFVNYGGYPEVVRENNINNKLKILKQYLDELFYKDFLERFEIQNTELGNYLLEFLITNSGKRISINKISDRASQLKIPHNQLTLKNYIRDLYETLNFYYIDNYHSKKIISKTSIKKTYVVDPGFLFLFFGSEEFGKKIETVVFLELLRKKNILSELYYYTTKDGYEIDFLIKEGKNIKELIQVTYASSYDEIPDREIRALLHAKEDLKLKEDIPLTVITWDYENEKQIEWWKKKGKIRFIPLWKFLLF